VNKQRITYEKGICAYTDRIFYLLFCATVLLSKSPVFAEESVMIRTSVAPDEVWVGQKAVMHVDVLARNGWAQIKKSGDIKIDGAYMLRVETQGTRLSENIDGDSYTGQRYELLIFPQIAGKISVPPFPVDVEVKAWGVHPENKVSQLSTPGVELNVKTPTGGESMRGLISTTELTVEQKWDSDTEPTKIGDAIKRIIIFKARDVSGMAFAPLEFQNMEGVGVYPGEPDVSDTTDRGTLSGERIEKVTYVFEQPGEFLVLEIVFFWWDIEKTELKRIELPGKRFEIAGAPAIEEIQQKKSVQVWPVILCVITLALVITLILTGKLRSLLDLWKKSRRENEVTYFRRIIKSARSGDARKTLRETMRWLDKINPRSGFARLDVFLSLHGDNRAKKEIAHLTHYMENNDPIPDIPTLINSLKKARRHWKQSLKKERQSEKLLPELNG
jgi:hypothetical protein